MGYITITISCLFAAYYLILMARAVLPWVSHDRDNRWFRLIYLWTDWLLNPIRFALPPEKIGMDVSPYAAIFLLYLFQRMIFPIL